jgi:hypothetical protein
MKITRNDSFKNGIENGKSERKIINNLQKKQWMNRKKWNGEQKQIKMYR